MADPPRIQTMAGRSDTDPLWFRPVLCRRLRVESQFNRRLGRVKARNESFVTYISRACIDSGNRGEADGVCEYWYNVMQQRVEKSA